MDARSQTYLKVKPMISAAAWDISRKYPSLTYDDALGECNLQFAKHMDAHDPDKGALSTYTTRLMRTAKSNIQDKFCSERGIPRARSSKKELTEEHLEACREMDNPQCGDSWNSGSEIKLFDRIGHSDPAHILFTEARKWDKDERALLEALYMGTAQGIEANALSISRNFPSWGRARAQSRLSALRKNVAEVLQCTR